MACGTADARVALRDEPLQGGIAGGDRSVGMDDGLELNACASQDPDEPEAKCDTSGLCGGLLLFDWSCVAIDAQKSCSLAQPSRSACLWRISPSVLSAGRYAFKVVIFKPDGESLAS